MKKKAHGWYPLFTAEDTLYGLRYDFTLYEGVLVEFNGRGHDTRVFEIIDSLAPHERLLYACASKGSVVFIWQTRVPERFREGNMVDIHSDGDSWCIESSLSVLSAPYYEPEPQICAPINEGIF